jgi:hypothetical protein
MPLQSVASNRVRIHDTVVGRVASSGLWRDPLAADERIRMD